MRIQPISNISFGYRSPLKDEFRKGNIPLKKCAYGGKLTKENVSLEHIIPHSKGGVDNMSNYLLVTKELNNARGNEPFVKNIDWVSLLEYFKTMLGVKTEVIDGVEYTKNVMSSIIEALKKGL